ncbi:MAG: hypothetical protein R3321_04315 [Nitrososphaeraceae archaeon]|nr:hypothetical protein [Nitrososphaeraceae archaeon]
MVNVKVLKYIILLFVTINTLSALAQRKDLVVNKMSDRINSDAEELYPLYYPAKNLLFFSRAFHPKNEGGKFAGTDIWSYDLNDSTEKAKNSEFKHLNNKSNNFIVGINEDQNVLYINQAKSAEKGFQFTKKINGSWIKPEGINIPGIPIEGYRGIYVSPDYSVIILSLINKDDNTQEDLYYCLKNEKGKWSKPQNLGPSINTPGKEISPFLSADKRKLYFSSNGHEGYGSMDIFMSERLYDNWEVWSRPKNLGAEINSDAFDAYYTTYGDTISFFCSNREGGLSDIYRVSMREKDIDQLASSMIRIKSDDYKIYDDNAVEELFGVSLNQNLKFKDNSEELEDSSKEFLYFIIDNMKYNPEIGIMILADKNNNKLTSMRFIKASMFFLKNGITSKRVTLIEEELENQPENEFLFYFYRLEE